MRHVALAGDPVAAMGGAISGMNSTVEAWRLTLVFRWHPCSMRCDAWTTLDSCPRRRLRNRRNLAGRSIQASFPSGAVEGVPEICRHTITIPDAIYVALARHLQAPPATADLRLAQGLRARHHGHHTMTQADVTKWLAQEISPSPRFPHARVVSGGCWRTPADTRI